MSKYAADEYTLTLRSFNEVYVMCGENQISDKCGPECDFWIKHKGCFFRLGKTPREWPDFEEIFERMKINDCGRNAKNN